MYKLQRIYNIDIVNRRKGKTLRLSEKSLWSYANLYFQPRNPMMYSVVHEKGAKDLAVVSVAKEILQTPGVFITDGNAANAPTQFYFPSNGLKMLRQQWEIVQNEWWNNLDGSKRKIMAECLVPNSVGPELINSVYVADEETRSERALERLVPLSNLCHPRTQDVLPAEQPRIKLGTIFH